MSRVKSSAVRDILKVAERPDILSFAGGLPAPELFPVEAIARAHAEVLAEEGPAALQYSTTEGFGPLREWIAGSLKAAGARVSAGEVLITNGSQQGLDLVAKVMIDPGDVIVIFSDGVSVEIFPLQAVP
jgi:2-aminoadipate transaminase